MQSSNDTDFESREELLLELQEGRAALPHYSEEDDVVTRLLQVPLDEPEWIVVVAAHDRRMLSTTQLTAGLRSGELTREMLVWRGGMRAWAPVSAIAELTSVEASCVEPSRVEPSRVEPSRVEPSRVEPARNARPVRRGPPGPFPAAHASPKVVVSSFDIEARQLHLEAAPSTRVKQVVMGLSALIMFGVFLIMFAISSARESAEPRARSRGAPAALPAAQATPDDTAEMLPTTAALLSEAQRNDPDLPAFDREPSRDPDTRERY